MNDVLNILVADPYAANHKVFYDVLSILKIPTFVAAVSSHAELNERMLGMQETPFDVLLINASLAPGSASFSDQIPRAVKSDNLTIGIYSHHDDNELIEEVFVRGANIFFVFKPEVHFMEKVLDHLLHVVWQYTTSGFRREHFMLSIDSRFRINSAR